MYITEENLVTSHLPPRRRGGELSELDQPTEAILVVRKGKDEFEYGVPSNNDLVNHPNPVVIRSDQLNQLNMSRKLRRPNPVASDTEAIVELDSDIPILTSQEKDEIDRAMMECDGEDN